MLLHYRRDRTEFYSDVMTLMGSRSPMVVCGDFNCVIDPTLDRQSRSRLGPRSSDINTMQTLLASLQVIDVYRKRHPTIHGFTRWYNKHDGDNHERKEAWVECQACWR